MLAENAIGRFVSRRETEGRVVGKRRGGRERRMVECSEPIEETPRQLQFHDLRDKLAQTNFRRPASPYVAFSPMEFHVKRFSVLFDQVDWQTRLFPERVCLARINCYPLSFDIVSECRYRYLETNQYYSISSFSFLCKHLPDTQTIKC